MADNSTTVDTVITAEQAVQLTRQSTRPLINKYLEEINKMINKAATQGENEIEFKFPDGTSANVVRQVQTALTSRGYSVSTRLIDLYQDNNGPLDIIASFFGTFDLAKLNLYSQYESMTLTISW
jgi:hypothetical protein